MCTTCPASSLLWIQSRVLLQSFPSPQRHGKHSCFCLKLEVTSLAEGTAQQARVPLMVSQGAVVGALLASRALSPALGGI